MGSREVFEYVSENHHAPFHLPPHKEESTFSLDFVGLAFTKRSSLKNDVDKMYVQLDFAPFFTVNDLV